MTLRESFADSANHHPTDGLFCKALDLGTQTKVIEQRASQQLSALAKVIDHLEQARLDYWLFGGWAVDFYVGSVTRSHADVDLAVWLVDAARIAQLLGSEGWQPAPVEGEDGGTGYERDGVRLELTYLIQGDDGFASIPMQSGPVKWLGKDGLAVNVGVLHGVRSRLIGLAALIEGKSIPRDDPEDAVKDQADFSELSRLQA